MFRIPRPSWFAAALCRGSQDRAFFPVNGRSAMKAKTQCAACPVIHQCLAHALADPSLTGVWGGTTETERDQMRARRNSA